MRVGITVPQFRTSVDPSIAAAVAAEADGIDGVFVFDHVWAIGRPDRPALSAWPLLGALSAETTRVALGTLVARVSLLPNAVLAHEFETLHRMVGDRLIAGLGAGDHLSEAENEAVDVPFPSAAGRRRDLADACRRTRALGIRTWVGGLSERTRLLALDEADALNLWGVAADVVADVVAAVDGRIEVTWGGPAPATVEATADLLRRLADAGATWAVCGPPYGVDAYPEPAVALVAEAAGRRKPDGPAGGSR